MSGAHVFIDRSQFPDNVQRDLIESLRARAINHKFHYESYKQAAKWLALHEACSPARNDPSCLRIYDEAFAAMASAAKTSERFSIVGLGCGGGQKEARLLEALCKPNRQLRYAAVDVSLPLVLTAREAALKWMDEAQCHTLVCDLSASGNLPRHLADFDATAHRILTLFGLVPNFEPDPLLSRVAALLRPADHLLMSVNLAAGSDYAAGVAKVLPQYENRLTTDWLMTFLLDLGFEHSDGELAFGIETDSRQLQRIVAHFELNRSRDIRVFDETISFHAGERIRVFFSYRHTVQTISALLSDHGFEASAVLLNDSGEEGVFLCRRATAGHS